MERIALEKKQVADIYLEGNLTPLPPPAKRGIERARELAVLRSMDSEDSQECYELFLHQFPGMALMKDLNGRITFVNQGAAMALGRQREEIIGRTDGEIHSAEVARRMAGHDRVVMRTRKMLEIMETIPQADGEHSWLVSRFPIFDASGKLTQIGMTGVDLTDRLHAEKRMLRLNRIHAVLSRVNSMIVRVRDRQDLLQEACRIAVEDGGFRLAWVGMHDKVMQALCPLLWAGEGDDFMAGLLTSARTDLLEGRDVVGNVMRSGRPFVVDDIANNPHLNRVGESIEHGLLAVAGLPLQEKGEIIGVLAFYAGETGVFEREEVNLLEELSRDLSLALEYIGKKEQLDYFAYYDPLTALPNRTLFCDQITNFAYSHVGDRMAVLMLKLDRFSSVNDTLGRRTGDALLKLVSERLRGAVDKAGELARVGGDAFAISLLMDVDAAGIAHVLEKQIFEAMGRPFVVEGQDLRLSFKCGIAQFPGDGGDAETLLKNAEVALKKARQSGEKYLFYAPRMNARVAEILSLENKLRIAIADDQFVLHYQPSIDAKTGRITRMEALIRWDSPELGLVQPAKFIPILEETGMILEVGKWALGRAMTDYLRWQDMGLQPPRVAVNISALQLREKEFRWLVENAYNQGKGALCQLDLEITESVIMEDIERYVPTLQAIREMGVGIAIDDFGTGYSSLRYLANLPVTALKIDQSFVQNMVVNPDSMAIVSTIISLAHSLNLKVIAEGVETDEQSRLLKLLKCDEMQGFLINHPLPPEQIEQLFRDAEM